MEVIQPEKISFQLISEATETQSPKSEIVIQGTTIKHVINGVDLESCIEHNGSFLIFTTDDCPFEESLNIYLISNENKVIDKVTLFWPYGTGSFEFIRFVDPDLVEFKFFENKIWQIRIFKTKRLFFPYVSEPSGTWRKFTFFRHFGVSEVK